MSNTPFPNSVKTSVDLVHGKLTKLQSCYTVDGSLLQQWLDCTNTRMFL
jgi:hypothetical protein